MKWYEDDHIAEIISTSGIDSARRFVSIDPQVDKPYLAMYPMEEMGFTQTQEFRSIRVKSDLLPGDCSIYDLAEFDVRYDILVQVHSHREVKGATKTMVLVTSELKDSSEGGVTTDEFDRWYRQEVRLAYGLACSLAGWSMSSIVLRLTDFQCCPSLHKHTGYLRTTRFKLAYSRNNQQSRVLKGLTSATDDAPLQPGTWLALHEFDCEPEQVNVGELEQLTSSPWTERIKAGLQRREIDVFRLANEFGEKDWFYGVEV